MSEAVRTAQPAAWIEPVAALVVFGLSLYINRSEPWPWMWVIDLAACGGAALSRRHPAIGAILTGLGLAFWLPFTHALPSMSSIAFYINIFAAARTNLTWKVPLTLGFGGLAYLTLVRNNADALEYRWTTAVLLLIMLAVSYAGGAAFRYAAHRVEFERETGEQRLEELQRSLARELHDSVAQTLASAAMRANIAMSDPGTSELARDQLERIADECRSSAHDLRQLLWALREDSDQVVAPGPLADVETLKRDVAAQAERLRAEGFTVDVDIQLAKLSAARCQTLAAITVEAANNVLKHGRPRSLCTFSIVADGDDVIGEFTNFVKSQRGMNRGFGLTGVQERLALLDGTCTVTHEGGQWTLRAQLPIGLERPLPPSAPVTLVADDASA